MSKLDILERYISNCLFDKIKCNGEYYNGLITDFNEGR